MSCSTVYAVDVSFAEYSLFYRALLQKKPIKKSTLVGRVLYQTYPCVYKTHPCVYTLAICISATRSMLMFRVASSRECMRAN